MAISFTKYVDIVSSVVATPAVANREFGARLFTINPLLPTGTLVEFDTAQEVGAYFGTTSEEYTRAVQYFSFISKSVTTPEGISYARWTNANAAPRIYGKAGTYVLGTFTPVINGAISLTIGGVTNIISALDFSSALSLADVAAVIEAGINAETGIQWTAATVTYDAVRKSFNFLGGDAVVADISATIAGSGTEILNLIGWGTGAIFSDGALTASITDTLQTSTSSSDNFGSFTFMPVLTLTQHQEAAAWNAARNPAGDSQFIYHVPTALADYVAWSASGTGLGDYGYTGLTILGITGQYHEQLPMEVQASTDFEVQNGVQNYMYVQQSTLTATVSDDATYQELVDVRVNFYGTTQKAGNNISFYQQGQLMGGVNDPAFMNVAANEIWLKDDIAVGVMNLQLAVNDVPASPEGRALLIATTQTSINKALRNGTISSGVELTDQQKIYIKNITNDADAFYQVQNSGYWLDYSIAYNSSTLRYEADYTLAYTKNNQVLKVNGRHLLM